MFTSNENGFTVRFHNGWTVSVQWGAGTYTENRWKGYAQNPDCTESKNAEVAAWDADGNDHEFGDGARERGWLAPDELVEFLAAIAAQPTPDEELQHAKEQQCRAMEEHA